MIEAHPLVQDPPWAAFWQRSERRAHAYRPSVHAELVVLFAVRGTAKYFVDGRVLPLAPGALLFAWSGAAHFLVGETEMFDMWVALVSARFADRVPGLSVAGNGAAPEARVIPTQAVRELSDLAHQVRHAGAAMPVGLAWWLVRAHLHWTDASAGASHVLHPAVDRAARFLRDDPNLDGKTLARRSGLSPGRLGVLFRAQMGQGIVAFRTAERLERAGQAIRVSGSDMTTAALDAGFGSYSQFYRACFATHGAGPREIFVHTKKGAP
ncbi:MAG: AraC family transcriptional regulator [Pseudomonadota bacterium]